MSTTACTSCPAFKKLSKECNDNDCLIGDARFPLCRCETDDGQVAALVFPLMGLIVIALGVMIFCWVRNRRQQDQEDQARRERMLASRSASTQGTSQSAVGQLAERVRQLGAAPIYEKFQGSEEQQERELFETAAKDAPALKNKLILENQSPLFPPALGSSQGIVVVKKTPNQDGSFLIQVKDLRSRGQQILDCKQIVLQAQLRSLQSASGASGSGGGGVSGQAQSSKDEPVAAENGISSANTSGGDGLGESLLAQE